jgi:hypothetical protein
VNHAKADADLDIVKTTMSFPESQEVVVMEEDTDCVTMHLLLLAIRKYLQYNGTKKQCTKAHAMRH